MQETDAEHELVTREHYPKAPIVQAIVDIGHKKTLDISTCVRAFDSVKHRIPKRMEVGDIESQVESAAGNVSVSARQKQKGYAFQSTDGRYVVRSLIDSFSFIQRGQYSTWEDFAAEAETYWTLYVAAAELTVVDRIAIRFVNRIDLPKPVSDLEDYFRTSPRVSPDMIHHLTGFFMQLQVPQPDIGALLILNQTLTEAATDNVESVILDLDLIKSGELGVGAVRQQLGELRARRNIVFEACITEKTRELFR